VSRQDFSLQILLDHLVLRWKRWSIGLKQTVWIQTDVKCSKIMKKALFAQLSCSYLQDARPQTVLVENPKTLDEKGKLVMNLSETLWPQSFVFPRCQVTKWTMNNQSDLTVLFLLIRSRWAMSPLVSPHGKDDQELLPVIVPGVAYRLNPSWTCITTFIIIVSNS